MRLLVKHQRSLELDLETLLVMRERLDCKRIILTHLGPTMLAHLGEVPLEIATDGLTTQV
ncbi:MAG TPA: hypothetical protein VKV73_23375 [Chloroflexota bacterium]|nr:hypothetical protein [Chloroflexota bacterium]